MVRQFLVDARERKEPKITHEDVAAQTGISRQYYGMIENGTRNPGVPLAKAIAEVLDIDWTLFFDQVGNKTLRQSKDAFTA